MVIRAFALLVVFFMIGCIGGRSPNTRVFIIDPEVAFPKTEKRLGGVLYVREFSVPDAYERSQIVVRQGRFELDYRAHELWVARPKRLLPNIIADKLTQSGLFDTATSHLADKQPTYEMHGELIALDVESFAMTPQAHLAISIVMIDFHTRNVLFRYTFDQREKLTDASSGHAAQAISKLMGKALLQMVEQLAKIKPKADDEAP